MSQLAIISYYSVSKCLVQAWKVQKPIPLQSIEHTEDI